MNTCAARARPGPPPANHSDAARAPRVGFVPLRCASAPRTHTPANPGNTRHNLLPFLRSQSNIFSWPPSRTGACGETLDVPTRLPHCRGSDESPTLTGVGSCERDSRVVREPVVASQRANDTDVFYFATLAPWCVSVNEDSRKLQSKETSQIAKRKTDKRNVQVVPQ
jgi:hypothetical protein